MESREMRDINQRWIEELVRSGETSRLTLAQKSFNEWMSEAVPADLTDTVWSLESGFMEDPEKQNAFFTYVGEHIRSIPPGQYLLHYLFGLYFLYFSEEEFLRLWDYIQHEEFNLDVLRTKEEAEQIIKEMQGRLARADEEGALQLTSGDYILVLSALCAELKPDLPRSFTSDNNYSWPEKFMSIVRAPALNDVQILALSMDWDWDTYRLFRSKALKKRGADFMNKKEVFIYLSLRYAKECGLGAYSAFNRLKCHYPDPARKKKNDKNDKNYEQIQNDKPPQKTSQLIGLTKEEIKRIREDRKRAYKRDPGDSSSILQEKLLKRLESSGRLRPGMEEKLFTKPLPFLQEVFQEMYELKKKRVKRSPHAVLLDEWNTFAKTVEITEYEGDNTVPDTYSPDGYLINRSKLFRFLYGDNVDKKTYEINPKRRGLKRIKAEDMVSLAPQGFTDFFLDSEEFFNTMITDAFFNEQQPITDETRLRNLLLTVGFLNFTYTDWETRENLNWNDPKAVDALDSLSASGYQDRLSAFDFTMEPILGSCGFISLHSGSAYDAFLKLLLSCDKPFDLFRYIWRMKTASPKTLDLIREP